MKEFNYQIKDALGLHARPASLLVKLARTFKGTEITVQKKDKEVSATKLIAVMGLDATCGDQITIRTVGPREEEAIEAVRGFIIDNL